MVFFDEHRRGLILSINQAEEDLRKAKLELFCYDKRETLDKHKLVLGRNYHFSPPLDVFVSKETLERCVFDGRRLKRACSAIFGGSNVEDTTVYQCPRCKKYYESPLNDQTKKETAASRQRRYA